MSAELELRAALVADAAVLALVGQQVAQDRAEEKWSRPYVVFGRTGSEDELTEDNEVMASKVTLEIQAWADERSEAEALADACKAAVLEAGAEVTSRSSGYDSDRDLEAVILIVEWWEL